MESKFFFLLLRFAGSVLPPSYMRGIGIVGRRVRGFLARRVSPHIGRGVNIERGAYVFPDTVLGDGSGIGANCEICRGLVVGKNVMMGRNACSIRPTTSLTVKTNALRATRKSVRLRWRTMSRRGAG